VGPSAAPPLAGRPDTEGAGPCQDPERASDRRKPACRHWPGTRAPGLEKARILSPRQLLVASPPQPRPMRSAVPSASPWPADQTAIDRVDGATGNQSGAGTTSAGVIPSFCIFERTVMRLRPRRTAAPRGPATTPFGLRSTSTIARLGSDGIRARPLPRDQPARSSCRLMTTESDALAGGRHRPSRSPSSLPAGGSRRIQRGPREAGATADRSLGRRRQRPA